MHITILLTLSIPPGEAELPVCVQYEAYLHPEPPGPDKEEGKYGGSRVKPKQIIKRNGSEF